MKSTKRGKLYHCNDGYMLIICPECYSDNVGRHEAITYKFGAYGNTKTSYYNCKCNDCGCEFQSESYEISKNADIDHWNSIDIIISLVCIIVAVLLVVGINVIKVY